MAAIKSRKERKPLEAPPKPKSTGLGLSRSKFPPSFQKPSSQDPHNGPGTQINGDSFGPQPPDSHHSDSLPLGEESLLSEAQQQLRKLLVKQLDTSHSSLESALGNAREFTPAVVYQPLASELRGLHSLSHFVSKEEQISKLDQLRQMGLTEQEIELKLLEEGATDLKPSSAKRSKLGAEPTAQQERLIALYQKISERKKITEEPTKYYGVKHMSRHAMEVERSLFRGSDVGNPLVHLTQEGKDKSTHKRAYPKSIMPTTTSASESGQDSESEQEDPQQDDVTKPVESIPALPVQVIERNRLTEAEIRALPRFKDYTPGVPSKVLYLKNLDSRVTADDLRAVVGGNSSTGPHIRLMTGRMRGQAFVEFDSVESATKALRLANGYQIRERPVIISYGRAKSLC